MAAKEKYLSNVLQQLEDFLKTNWPPHVWIENTAISVYVRQAACVSALHSASDGFG